MKKGSAIIILLLLLFNATAQWKYHFGIGKTLGGAKDIDERVVFQDSLEFQFERKSLTFPSFSIMFTDSLNEKWTFRTGLGGTASQISVHVDNLNADGNDLFFEARKVGDLHVPAELLFSVNRWISFNAGLALKYRAERRLSLEERMAYSGNFRPSTIQEYDRVAYHSLRTFNLDYRAGVTLHFTRWLGIDLVYDKPIWNVIKSPLTYQEVERNIEIKYHLWMLRVVFSFQDDKVKEFINR
jgi:hypothetical protein